MAMRDRYGANERSQKLKYHVQTSGRSLHAQEMSFNDIRTTLQALMRDLRQRQQPAHQRLRRGGHHAASEESVRRALAIQLIINREWGLADEREPAPGVVHRRRADRPGRRGGAGRVRPRSAERGGVLGAMETGYQRGRIQDESMLYEQRKHDGSLPIVGVNTFRNPHGTTSPSRSSWPAAPSRRRGRSWTGVRSIHRRAPGSGARGAGRAARRRPGPAATCSRC